MPHLFLSVNIGNTNIVLGLYNLESENLLRTWRISSVPRRTEDEHRLLLQALLMEQPGAIGSICGCLISSVIPRLEQTLFDCIRAMLHINPILLSHDLDLGVRNAYSRPEDVGPDRLANAAGGVARYGPPFIIVDSGTATTFDIVDPGGTYLGGIIMPGLEMSADALFQKTSRLPRIAIQAPEKVIGRSTAEAINSGLIWGTTAAADRLIALIREELGIPGCPAIATGGYAQIITQGSSEIQRVDADLTLFGMLQIWKRNSRLNI